MRLSIVTINYNNAEGLRKTLASVAAQTYRDIEHIIVDAASTDGSVDVIKEYVSINSLNVNSLNIIWSSEPDGGVYAGMNKGIRKATGDYVFILNSGDAFVAPDVVERMCNELENERVSEIIVLDTSRKELGRIDILIGNILHAYPNGKKAVDGVRRKVFGGKPQPMDVSMLTFYSGTVPHDAAFVRRDLFEKFGCFDEKMKICADWKLYLDMIALGGVQPMYVNIDVVLFDMTGVSNRDNGRRLAERRAYLEQVLPPSVLKDYDAYARPIRQYERLKKHHLWGFVTFIERVLFKLERWKIIK